MKLLRLSFLINYFSLAKNKRKALIAINTGIFLSLFAASSAMVTLYIENKISEFEYMLIINSEEKRALERDKIAIYQFSSDFNNVLITNESFRDFYDFLSHTNFGSKIISAEDRYIPLIYDVDEITSGDIINQEDLKLIKENVEYYFETVPETKEKYLKILNQLNSLFSDLILPDEKIKKYKKIMFDSDLKNLTSEINSEKGKLADLYTSELYQHSTKTIDLIIELQKALKMFEELFLVQIASYDEAIKFVNEEIIKQSRLERNLVISIFILQFVIFIIIQFFEISSVNLQLKKAKKILLK